jgi:hypothetical protein
MNSCNFYGEFIAPLQLGGSIVLYVDGKAERTMRLDTVEIKLLDWSVSTGLTKVTYSGNARNLTVFSGATR